jgi:transposase
MTATIKWDEARTEELKALVGSESPVSGATVEKAAEALGTSVRSVAAKLRKVGFEVASMAKEHTSKFSEDEAEALREFVEANDGVFTYAEIAAQFSNGKFTTKQIQGKILSMELTGSVKPTEKVEVARTYTEQEEAAFVQMVQDGKFVEEIADKLGKSINSVRGKALSLLRSGEIDKIPAQKESHAKDKEDVIASLDIENMTVAAIAEATSKTERGVKTLLTRRGLKASDYDGEAKKAKAEAAKVAA